jgi:hypothetical protein
MGSYIWPCRLRQCAAGRRGGAQVEASDGRTAYVLASNNNHSDVSALLLDVATVTEAALSNRPAVGRLRSLDARWPEECRDGEENGKRGLVDLDILADGVFPGNVSQGHAQRTLAR